MGCLTFFFFYFVWWGVLISPLSPIMPKCSFVISDSEYIDKTTEQIKELNEKALKCTSEFKWAWNKATLFAFPLSIITTNLTYKQR